jgi:ATP-dependent protease ClpP protease subunit
MATTDGVNAEIKMYGEVVTERPVDWWTGEELAGDYIVLSEFLEDMNQLGGAKDITLRLNSVGGEVYAALPIYNRLRELKAEITASIVDGVAMSTASFIMCAAEALDKGFADELLDGEAPKIAVSLFSRYFRVHLTRLFNACNPLLIGYSQFLCKFLPCFSPFFEKRAQ